MPEDNGKKYVTVRAAKLAVFFFCLIGLSVVAAYQFARVEFKKQLAGSDLQTGDIRKIEKALAGRNVELLNSLKELKNEFGRHNDTMMAAETDAAEQGGPASLEPWSGAVIQRTWVGAGKAVTLFGGGLRIVLRQASPGMCPTGATVAGAIRGGEETKNVCLKTGAPVKFKFRGKSYTMNLSGIAGVGNVYHYYIVISE